MRITAKIATAGKAGLSRFPCLKYTIAECLDKNGRLDYGKAVESISSEQVQWSEGDDRVVVAFALEYLKQQEAVVRSLAQDAANGAAVEWEDEQKMVHLTGTTAGDMHCERNMKRGRFCYVRVDIRHREYGIRVSISSNNPKGVVGASEQFARDYAIMIARILGYIRSDTEKDGFEVRIVEGEGCEGVLADAASDNEKQDRKKISMTCGRHAGCYCSKPKFDCPNYKDGRCTEVKA